MFFASVPILPELNFGHLAAVLSPLGALIFILFIAEIIVPGRAHKRVLEENARLNEAIQKVVPIAERALDGVAKNTTAVEEMAKVLEIVAKTLSEATRKDEPTSKE